MIKRLQQYLQVDPTSDEYKRVREGSGKKRVRETLEDALKKLHGYIDGGEPVVWIVGAPGCGKTTLLTALRAQVRTRGNCVASYCFPEGGGGEISRVWPNIAYQASLDSRAVRDALSHISDRGSHTTTLEEQFRELIMEPLREREPQRRLVIFIDGVDKALFDSRSGVYDDYVGLLGTFDQWRKACPPNSTLVVSSRVLYKIQQFVELSHCKAVVDLSGPSRADAADKDITRFLRERFGQMRQFSLPPVGSGHKKRWPGQDVLDEVVQYAAGSYLWATAAGDYVTTFGDKDEGLRMLLRDYRGRIPVQPGVELYESYIRTLQHIHSTLDMTQLNLIFQFLGALMAFKQPPSFSQLVQLELLPAEIQGTQGTRDFDVHALAKKLGVLLPYIVWDGDGQRMRIFHPSFTAMLQARHKYTINARIQHGSLIRALLRWLNKNLHFDMGGVNTSHVAPSSPPRLDPMFIYVARYLPDHFRSATIASSEKGVGLEADIIRELETFCSRHFLHWLEIVSLLKATASVPAFLSGVHYWVKVSLFRASSMFRYL